MYIYLTYSMSYGKTAVLLQTTSKIKEKQTDSFSCYGSVVEGSVSEQ